MLLEQRSERLVAPVQLVDSVVLGLNDTLGLQQATSPRNEEDYLPQRLRRAPYTLPVNILRPLANDESIGILREAAGKADVPDLHLTITRHHIVPGGDAAAGYRIPLHFGTAFSHSAAVNGAKERVRVAGPIFISTLHSVLESPNLSPEEKARITEGILTEYVDQSKDYDVSVVSMPKRKHEDHSFEIKSGNSLTHTLMLRASRSLNHYRERGNSGMYFLAHAGELNQAKRDALFNDERFLEIASSIGTAWSANFQREIQRVASSDFYDRQKEEVVDTLARSF